MFSVKHRYQLLGTVCANVICLAYGIATGWPAASFPELLSTDSPLPSGPLDMDQLSWIGSNISIGAILGTFYFGWASDRFGRKNALIQSALPNIVGCALLYIAQNAFYLNVYRLLLGFSGGGSFVIIPIYVSEIADTKIRGALGSLLLFSCNSGMLIAFIVGDIVQYSLRPLIFLTVPIVFLCGFCFFPETPIFLLKNHRYEEAEKSLRFYRNISDDDIAESGAMLKSELQEMHKIYVPENKNGIETAKPTLATDLRTKHGKRAAAIAVVIVIASQTCGVFPCLTYTASILTACGSNMPASTIAIIIGVFQLFGDYIATVFIDRAGRKFLLFISALGTAISLTSLSAYIYLNTSGYDVSAYGWVPVVCLSGMVLMANVGYFTVPFVYVAEILPSSIRSFGLLMSTVLLYSMSFVMLKGFPPLVDAAGFSGSMLIFAAFSFAGAVYIMIKVPETKGKSFDEIKEIMEK